MWGDGVDVGGEGAERPGVGGGVEDEDVAEGEVALGCSGANEVDEFAGADDELGGAGCDLAGEFRGGGGGARGGVDAARGNDAVEEGGDEDLPIGDDGYNVFAGSGGANRVVCAEAVGDAAGEDGELAFGEGVGWVLGVDV